MLPLQRRLRTQPAQQRLGSYLITRETLDPRNPQLDPRYGNAHELLPEIRIARLTIDACLRDPQPHAPEPRTQRCGALAREMKRRPPGACCETLALCARAPSLWPHCHGAAAGMAR